MDQDHVQPLPSNQLKTSVRSVHLQLDDLIYDTEVLPQDLHVELRDVLEEAQRRLRLKNLADVCS